ncbi:MAG: radical SAM protein [Nanoarchaeota archaeon]
MISLAKNIIGYKLQRNFGFPRIMPNNVAIAVTNKCNSLCKTCRIGEIYRKNPSIAKNELSLEEYKKIFHSLKKVYWFVVTGGEPLLREDIIDIVESGYKICKPKIIVIPTNCLLGSKVIGFKVREIVKKCPKAIISVNLSLDEIGSKNDEIRGIKGDFEKVVEVYNDLKKIKNKNFELGIHTVISKFNVKNIPQIYSYVMKNLEPDAYITEIAEKRVELDTMNMDITPNLNDYSASIDFLIEKLKKQKFTGFTKVKQMSRIKYYELVKKIMKEKKQIIPCFAGISHIQITPQGDVWCCAVRGDSFGNLRSNDYNVKKVIFSEKSVKIKKSIKNKECYCPIANIMYSNMLCNFKSVLKIVFDVV